MRPSPLPLRPSLSASIHGVRAALSRPRGVCLLTGALGGVYLLGWCQQFIGEFGTSLPMVTGLALALALGAELGLRLVDGPRERPGFPGALHFALAAWTVALPWTVDAILAITATVPVERLAVAPVRLGYALAVAMLLIGIPVFLLARLAAKLVRHVGRHSEAALLRAFVGGLLAGLLGDAFLIAPLVGVQAAALVAALIGGLVFLRSLMAATSPEPPLSAAQRDDVRAAQPVTASAASVVCASVAIVCVGVLVSLAFRVVTQLSAASAYLLYAAWAALGLGWLLGSRWTQRRRAADSDVAARCAWACLVAAAWSAVVLAGFDQLVHGVLTINAFVSSVAAQMLLRSAMAAVVLLPFGWAWGALAAGPGPARRSVGLSLCSLPLIGGYLAGRWFGIPLLGVVPVACAAGYGLLLLAAAAWIARRPLPPAWWRRAVVAAVAIAALAGPLAWTTYDPAASAELLFSTNVFLARQSGLDPEMLRVLDEGRELARVEGEQGTLTLWKHRGLQYQLRESGVPKAVATTAPHICPHYSPEVLQAAIPLVLHERPRHVLLLGLGGGVSLATSIAFPVQDVTCAEGDRGLVGLLRDHVWPGMKLDPQADGRVRLLPLDPAVAVACRAGGYDVIVSSPDMAALHRSTPYFTRDFYRQAARQLAAEGIFCQRLQCLDFGPGPLRTLARTMRSAFRHVVFLEVAAGELVLLGTNSPKGLVRDGIMDRVQAPHVRRTLAQLGWDWSTPLNLSAFNDEALDKIARQDSPARWLLHKLGLAESPQAAADVNTAADPHLAFTLPQEVMRWAPKMQEVYALLAPHSGRLAEWGEIDDTDSELLRRLSEVAGQRKLMAENADQYWDYRQAVRDQIKQGARTRVIPVKGSTPRQELHPVDRRRMAYFETLGKALNERPVHAATIDRVAEFAAPYDPLISYFLHQEVAELHARAVDRDVQAELGHRLHAIYFAHAADRSVRDLAAALRLLAEHPEAVESPQARFDHMNALLQLLRIRWELRGANPPAAARILMNDADECLSAAKTALAALDELSRELPAAATDWSLRREYLERTVERPLRTYRTRLLPHHLKDLRKTREALDEFPGADE